MNGTKYWKIGPHLERAIEQLHEHSFRSTRQLGQDIGIHQRMAAAIFLRGDWERWSGKAAGSRGVVYMRTKAGALNMAFELFLHMLQERDGRREE